MARTCQNTKRSGKRVKSTSRAVVERPKDHGHDETKPKASKALLEAIRKFKEYRKLGYTPVKLKVTVDLSDMEFFVG